MKNLPKSIEKCPIVEVILEVRFEPNIMDDAIIGLIHNELKNDYPKVERLPILQIPEQILTNDPNLRYRPRYALKPKNSENDICFNIQVGPRVITLVNLNQYVGWDSFFSESKKMIGHVQTTNVVKSVRRLGLRYINFLPQIDIFEKSNLTIQLNNDALNTEQKTIDLKIKESNFFANLKLANNGELTSNQGTQTGSLFDIDVFQDFEGEGTQLEKVVPQIKNAHDIEKNAFFSYLKHDFIETLQPKYA